MSGARENGRGDRRRNRRRGRGRGDGGSAGSGARGGRSGGRKQGKGSGSPGGQRRARHERSAGGVVVRIVDGTHLFLLIRDSYGHWGFPKGHLERGEGADRAAVREVMEETGLRAVSLLGSIASIDWHFRFRGTLIHKSCEFFLMQTTMESTRPQKSEGITACRWSPLDEATRLIAYENARDVLRRAGEMLAALRAPARSGASTPVATA